MSPELLIFWRNVLMRIRAMNWNNGQSSAFDDLFIPRRKSDASFGVLFSASSLFLRAGNGRCEAQAPVASTLQHMV
jgi:hypothetical protein